MHPGKAKIVQSNASTLVQRPTDYTGASLAGMLVLVGVAYSLPFALYPSSHQANGPTSPEILNLHFVVAWMGLAHFIYAYRGQAISLLKTKQKILPFLSLLGLGAAILVALRHWLGYMYFSFAMWIYFLPHFVKAELFFSQKLNGDSLAEISSDARVYLFPAIAFTFFTFALFAPIEIISNRWNVLALALITLASGMALRLKDQLKDPRLSKYALLAIFLIAEGMAWATYRKYMVFQFQQGVYVFHIAMASFYHYLRSYDFANLTSHAATKRALLNAKENSADEQKPNETKALEEKLHEAKPQTTKSVSLWPGIVAVNLAVIALGYLLSNEWPEAPSKYIFDVSYFTFWVGLHQYASDVFNWLKKQRA